MQKNTKIRSPCGFTYESAYSWIFWHFFKIQARFSSTPQIKVEQRNTTLTYRKKQKIIRCKFIPSIILYKNQYYQRVDQRKRKKKKRTTIDLLVKFTYHSETSAQKCSTKCPSGVADSLDVIRRQKSPHFEWTGVPRGRHLFII